MGLILDISTRSSGAPTAIGLWPVPASASMMSSHRPAPSPLVVDAATSDADLVTAVTGRQEPALAEIYRRHGGAVFGLSQRVLGDGALAEDVTQEVFLRLWKEPERFDPTRGSLRSFLQRQAHSRSIERIRSEEARRRREDRSVLLDRDSVAELEADVLRSIESARVRAALDHLPANERDVIVAAYFGGHSYREVARSLELPEGTVKSRIRSGLTRLSALLDEPEVNQ